MTIGELLTTTVNKIFLDQPGNIKELAEYAKEKDLPVTVLFHSKWEADLTGFSIANGETIYSVGTKEEQIARVDKRFIQELPFTKYLATPSIHPIGLERVCEEVILRLKEEAQTHLRYLDSKHIKYDLVELNEARTLNSF